MYIIKKGYKYNKKNYRISKRKARNLTEINQPESGNDQSKIAIHLELANIQIIVQIKINNN